MSQLTLRCQCGAIEGAISPAKGNHVKCYCVDCQAFSNYLQADAKLLDEHGGTASYQIAPWNFHISKGLEQVQCLRLKAKGLNRWFAKCCNTPIANTINAKVPFLGINQNFIVKDDTSESIMGPIIAFNKIESAYGNLPQSIIKTGMPASAKIKIAFSLLKFKLTMKGKGNLLFDANGRTINKPLIVKQ